MIDGVANTSSSPLSDQAGSANAGLAARTGSFKGQDVTIPDMQKSILSDAAEEMTFLMAEKVESKRVEEREIETESPLRSMPTEEILAYLQQSKHQEDAEKMAALVKLMTTGSNPRQLAKQNFKDITQQYLALQYAASEGEKSGASREHLEAIHDAIADMEAEFGAPIHADLNTVRISGSYDNVADVANFQSAYQDVVLGEGTLAQTFKVALQRFGDGDFVKGLGNLKSALGDDLAATRPSTDPRRLQMLVQDLYHLQVASTVLDAARELAEKLNAG